MSVKSRPARLYVANRRAKPIVSTSGSSAVVELCEDRRAPRRAARTGCAAGRGRRSRARASGAGGPPTARRRDALEALPEAVLPRARVEVGRGRRRGSARTARDTGPPTHVGGWTPFVIGRDLVRRRCPARSRWRSAAWSLLTALAPFVSRRLNAVMSNWLGSPSVPRARAPGRCSTGTPPPAVAASGPATRRTRSASKRSLPAETGVWIVNTLFRETCGQRVVERRAGGDELARSLGEQERRVALVEVPDRRARCRARAAPGRRRCRGPAPGAGASRARGRTGCW